MEQNFILTQKQLYSLAQVYNGFLEIHTQGEESFLYTDIMRTFKKVIQEIENTLNKEE